MQLSGDSPNRWVGPAGRVIAGRLHGRRRREAITSFTVQPSRTDLEHLAELIEDGAVRTHIGETWDLNEVGVGLERLEAGHTRGKAVVKVASTGPEIPIAGRPRNT